ncbi:MAG: hypothetical protein JOY90_35080 [Bradyrhizobium sp.]|uniref:GAP1-N1 domain-containing protein n=1 Tax=Bradyrhizobium sp. TaxID=376 RepID=UPI001D7D2850|nr:hypothetical protein [Bradyrhizobium sp.]MBV9565639.1 hypothetical protein [Bradyrhizobium sp.]
MEPTFDEQEHGYRSGHELLHATIKLGREDQETVDRLSDIAGSLRPGEKFAPYVTAYPLPSRSHYVVARTWQDIEAPRAGCVLTKSLFISMEVWEQTRAIPQIVSQLDQVHFAGVPSPFAAEHVRPRPIEDSRRIELAEALFLEERQPIVVFDSKEAEDITLRLLSVFWPNLRRNFAVCTFTLAPRRIENRWFDLLFAPSSARGRFGAWSGRKILPGNVVTARHRWSAAIASQIFEADLPSLQSNDGLGVLLSDPDADEGVLRLSLLWKELASKVAETPSAVLGMLDIVNSQPKKIDDLVQKITPVLDRAILQTATSDSVPEAWSFLATLFGKFQGRPLPQEIAVPVEDAARLLTHRDPVLTIEAVSSQVLRHHVQPREVYSGVGTALTEVHPSEPLLNAILHAAHDAIIGLLSTAPAGSRAIVRMADEFKALPALAKAMSGVDAEMAAQLRSNIVPLIRHETEAVLLPPILVGITNEDLASLARRVFEQAGFVGAALGDAILRAARSSDALSRLRNVVADQFRGAAADAFLVRTLSVNMESVSWLESQVAPDRARSLLRSLIDRTNDQALMAGQRERAVLHGMMNLLIGDVPSSAQQIARLLEVGQVSSRDVFEIGVQLLPHLNGQENARLITLVAEEAFSHVAFDDPRVEDVASWCARAIGIVPLIRFAALRSASSKRVGANVRILDLLEDPFRLDVLDHIDDLSERLVSHGLRGAGASAYKAWGRMLEDASRLNRQSFLRAAAPTLAFALRQTSEPASPLVVATFPVIYAQLLRSNDEGPSLPMIVLAPLSIFVDWDKAKAGRKDLIAAFMRSIWPPSDLLRAADKAGIAKKVLQRIRRSHDGEKYLGQLQDDVAQMPDSQGGKELRALLRVVQSGEDDEWD